MKKVTIDFNSTSTVAAGITSLMLGYLSIVTLIDSLRIWKKIKTVIDSMRLQLTINDMTLRRLAAIEEELKQLKGE